MLFEKTHCYFQLSSDSMKFLFCVDFSVWKDSLLKLIFEATELYQRPQFSMFQRLLFCILASSTNLVLKLVLIEAGQVSHEKYLRFSNLKLNIFGASVHSYTIKNQKQIFQKTLHKIPSKHLYVFTQFSFPSSETVLHYPQQKDSLTSSLTSCEKT